MVSFVVRDINQGFLSYKIQVWNLIVQVYVYGYK